ncbi:hypothetical protein DPMN_174479 [Dreissena polymorpha]|uniref:Uncharacterized protein n=1 Tax=Dreissena polymorpha TaxID=45954 RepID=A0A9D4E623_DREPO|nr:hypothetical protein DPMN_174479 [Dreissena polymorpha]
MTELLRNLHNSRQKEYLGSECSDIRNTHSELSGVTDASGDLNVSNCSQIHLQSKFRARSYLLHENCKKLNDIGRERLISNRTCGKSIGSSECPDVFD